MFVFLTLAFVKRQRELHAQASGDAAPGGRAWQAEDVPVVAAFGAASGLAAALVFALYIQTPQVSELYARPEFLWLICPLLIYWLGRMTLLANRGLVDHDPVLFALGDRTSWLTGLAIVAALLAALRRQALRGSADGAAIRSSTAKWRTFGNERTSRPCCAATAP